MIVGMLVLFFVFDWRLGLACLVAVIISLGCMFYMMGGRGMDFMTRYMESLVKMNKTGTEYVRGIPVVKVFQAGLRRQVVPDAAVALAHHHQRSRDLPRAGGDPRRAWRGGLRALSGQLRVLRDLLGGDPHRHDARDVHVRGVPVCCGRGLARRGGAGRARDLRSRRAAHA